LTNNITSCSVFNEQEKKSSGIYKVDFTGLEKDFTNEEILYYSNVYLNLNSDGSFRFSKLIIGAGSQEGVWKIHEDPLSGLIVLRGIENTYYSEIGRCEKINGLIRVSLPEESYKKKLPFRKIKHEFPELIGN